MLCPELTALKVRIDADYKAAFPGQNGWEMGALLLLFAHDDFLASNRAFLGLLDPSKYFLMHALRWGGAVPSAPLLTVPRHVSPSNANLALQAIQRGMEYTQFIGGYGMREAGVIPAECHGDHCIEFGANAQWSSFDVLDDQLNDRAPRKSVARRFRKHLKSIVQSAVAGAKPRQTGWKCYPLESGGLRQAMPFMRQVNLWGYRLPHNWEFEGIPIEQIRCVWDSITLLSCIHGLAANDIHPAGTLSFGRLMMWPRQVWVERIRSCAEIDSTAIRRIVEVHTYDRNSRLPDIALTPLVSIGSDLLATSPKLIESSALERNFCAHVARDHQRVYNSQSHKLEGAMAADLVKAFQAAGFRARARLAVRTSIGNTDLDLVVWSTTEQYVLTAELVSFIPAADFMEVVHREKEATDKMKTQLPKHAAALREDAPDVLLRAFGLRKKPDVTGSTSLLVMRGYVGSPRIPSTDFSFISEDLLALRICNERSLRKLAEWCKNMDYLPVEGRDFCIRQTSFRSQSGVQIRVHGVEP